MVKPARRRLALTDTTFRDGNQSRILEIWDQRDEKPAAQRWPEFGRIHTQADLNSYIAKNEVPPILGQAPHHGQPVLG